MSIIHRVVRIPEGIVVDLPVAILEVRENEPFQGHRGPVRLVLRINDTTVPIDLDSEHGRAVSAAAERAIEGKPAVSIRLTITP